MAKGSDHSLSVSSHAKSKNDAVGAGGQSQRRTAGTVKRLQMYRCSKPRRNAQGKIIKQAPFQSFVESGTRARIEPGRSWFANTKTISQRVLQQYHETMKDRGDQKSSQVILKKTSLPLSMLEEKKISPLGQVPMIRQTNFSRTFGKSATRKRPKLAFQNVSDLLEHVNVVSQRELKAEPNLDMVDCPREYIFAAGQSKRIWNELYKVVDSSDVLIEVIDARDPLGTRSYQIEQYLKKDKPTKQLILLMTKIDLIPPWLTQKWLNLLNEEYPTLAFHGSVRNPFGKGALYSLLRQISKFRNQSNQISVGFIGYPNVGKSSAINALRGKKVCNVAPIAGETKVWQYIKLMKKIYLIDSPGVVHPSGQDSDVAKVLKGVVRVELVGDPTQYIESVLQTVKPEHIKKTYTIPSWSDAEDFLKKLATKSGKLLKGGEPDLVAVSKMVLNDFQRGKLPYFKLPPGCVPPGQGQDAENITTASGMFEVTEAKTDEENIATEADVPTITTNSNDRDNQTPT
ncbi:hypothetical protein TCAL_11124 [Tigriopus californicus]|uniref:Nucleolar GTP-binding protein 2 n=1 Tax=Tigriopus californicus TaxID=6832 RepID=A0A553NQD0_TIGCA|nr:nucleolar GTP-binding protein 2-like [Tigriopus californicus]TRY67627.1 hypothetical protein TCAL_11124 [Tigriopus californicus]|eukprot:TCALIF_11124-PA protein Name:"Similar to Gnl2 Nucleolar GTP-binding protein 2 (Mus musculus)" AED:0.02 eAED:0.02 QI:0/-1/0/1/-1/1/1/0/513